MQMFGAHCFVNNLSEDLYMGQRRGLGLRIRQSTLCREIWARFRHIGRATSGVRMTMASGCDPACYNNKRCHNRGGGCAILSMRPHESPLGRSTSNSVCAHTFCCREPESFCTYVTVTFTYT